MAQDVYGEYFSTILPQASKPMLKHDSSAAVREKTFDLCVSGGMVVLPETGIIRADVYIKDGKVRALTQERPGLASEVLDAAGKYVLPGIIDPHVHLGIFAPLPLDFEYETAAALHGGITTVGLYISPEYGTPDGIEEVAECVSRHSLVDVFPHLIINNRKQIADIPDLVKRYGIRSFKVYMTGIRSRNINIPEVDDAFILEVMEAIRSAGEHCILCVHTENSSIVYRANEILRERVGDNMNMRNWVDTHPAIAEEEALRRISFFSQRERMPVYMVHMSTKEGARSIKQLKHENPLLNVETTSAYLSLVGSDIPDASGKMEPPIREAADKDALWDALANGLIDCIGTDNTALTAQEKHLGGSFWDVLPGYPMVETHLSAILDEGVHKRSIPLDKISAAMTVNPARIFGLYPHKGTLIPGSDADMVLVDLDATAREKELSRYTRSDISLYGDRVFRGIPVATIRRGRVCARNGRLTPESRGRCLIR